MQSEKIHIPIESMAKVFEKLHISYDKLIDLYIDQTEVDSIIFETSQLRKYLSEEELTTYRNTHIEESLLYRGRIDYGNKSYEIVDKYRKVTRNFSHRLKTEGKNQEDELISSELIEMLNAMQRRPGMYLGKCTIDRLYDFLSSALYGARCLAKADLDPNGVWGLFCGWLKEKYKIKGNYSWLQVILQVEPDEEKAIGRFFEEFWSYLAEMSQYHRKKDVINYLYERLGLTTKQREEKELVEELIAYPNQTSQNHFNKQCYIISVYKIGEEGDGENKKYTVRRLIKNFYIQQDFEQIWVQYKYTTLYQGLEEFLKDNEKWYE